MMDNSMEDVVCMGREGQQDASQWQGMQDEPSFPCAYNPDDNEQLLYDVPLPVGLIQDHPEPLLIDRRLLPGTAQQTSGKHSHSSTTAGTSGYDTSSRRGDGFQSDDSGGALPLCNAEPMTQEEAEAFDQTSMGSCFLEFSAFGMSRMSRDESREASLRTLASQNAAEAMHRFQAEGVLLRPSSLDEGSRQMQASGSTDGSNPSSNRSSFDAVPAAASSRLYGSTAWGHGSNNQAGSSSHSQPPTAGNGPPDNVQQQPHRRSYQAPAQAAAQGTAPGNARAAHQALSLGLPDSCPRLNLTQKDYAQASLQQMQSQQGATKQAQQQHTRGTTPVLQQSHMQLSLGMGLGLTLDLGSWHYGMTTSMSSSAADTAAAVTPRASAATHRRRAGAPVEEYPADQADVDQRQQGELPSWPVGMRVAAVTVQNVGSNKFGTALTAADLLPPPAKAQAAQDAAHAQYAQHLAGAVKQEALQGSNRQFNDLHAAGDFTMGNAPRALCKTAGLELSVRHESLERYRDKKRRRVFSNAKTIRYEKRKVNADRRPRVKGRFVKQMNVDMPLGMIDEHSQALPPPNAGMEHASDADCSGEDEDPPASAIHVEEDPCNGVAPLVQGEKHCTAGKMS